MRNIDHLITFHRYHIRFNKICIDFLNISLGLAHTRFSFTIKLRSYHSPLEQLAKYSVESPPWRQNIRGRVHPGNYSKGNLE